MATKGADITKWASADDGEFRRHVSSFRDKVSREPGAKFAPEKDRYHLYVSYACPWAHRTLITRELKGLQDIIPITVVHWHLQSPSWRFITPEEQGTVPGAELDTVTNSKYLKDIYEKACSDYEGRYTVPTLWDKKLNTIVNNESAEIIRMFYTEFDDLVGEEYKGVTFLPKDLEKDIDEINEWTYDKINNGVYKCGFASTQKAYENHIFPLFDALDKVEAILKKSNGPYVFGDKLTEIDIRLYTTIIRFDPVYVQHFKCNIAMIRDDDRFPNLHKWVRHLYWDIPAFHNTTDFEHIKKHYTKSHTQINPFSITPAGPIPNIKEK